HEVGGDARAFGPNRAFGDLHDDFAAGRIQTGNVPLRDFGPGRPAVPPGGTFDNFHAAVELVRHDVPIMQERIFLETDVHERGLETVFQVADLALEDAADEAFLGGAFNVEFSSLPSSITATRVSSVSALMTISLWIFFSGRMRRWTLLTRLVAATLMVSRMPFGDSFIATGSNGFSSSTWAGVSRCGSRNSF